MDQLLFCYALLPLSYWPVVKGKFCSSQQYTAVNQLPINLANIFFYPTICIEKNYICFTKFLNVEVISYIFRYNLVIHLLPFLLTLTLNKSRYTRHFWIDELHGRRMKCRLLLKRTVVVIVHRCLQCQEKCPIPTMQRRCLHTRVKELLLYIHCYRVMRRNVLDDRYHWEWITSTIPP